MYIFSLSLSLTLCFIICSCSLSVSGWGLALRGVGEDEVTAEHLSVQRGEAVGRLRVDQAKELQLVDVQMADGLHDGKLRHHLKRKREEIEA